MKKQRFLTVMITLFFVAFFSSSLDAQQTEEPKLSREEMQLQRAQQSVQRAEASLARAQAYLDEGDSLNDAGSRMMTEAKEDIKVANNEKAALEKAYNSELKTLQKQSTSKDKPTAENAKKEIRELSTKHRDELRVADGNIKAANAKYETGRKNIEKGKEKQKLGNEKLKPAQKALAEAEKQLEAITGPPDKEIDDSKIEDDASKKDKKKEKEK